LVPERMLLFAILLCVSVVTINGNDCPTCISTLATCIAETIIPGNPDACGCLSNFKTASGQYCTSPADALLQLTTCNTNKNLCNSGFTCDVDCQALVNLIPGCQQTYSDCTGGDKCVCYTELTACMALYDVCDDVKVTQLKACVENQFDCISVQGTCDSSEHSITLSDVDALFNQYNDRFISLWNQALTSVAATVATCQHVATSSKITWTLTVDFNSTQHSIDAVLTAVIGQFSQTVGVQASQLSGVVLSSSKRGIQGNTGTLQVTAAGQGNGSSMVSVFLLPIILFNGLLFLFFN